MNLPGVKPPKDWVQRHFTFNFNLESLIADVQEEAFAAGVQQGMTKAAEIAGAAGCSVLICGDEFHGQRCPVSRQHAILAARDAINSTAPK